MGTTFIDILAAVTIPGLITAMFAMVGFPKRLHFRLGFAIGLIITIITMTAFYPIRHIIRLGLSLSMFLFLGYFYFKVRRLVAENQKLTEFYGQQLARRLRDYRIISMGWYGYEHNPTPQVRLFIADESYQQYIHPHTLSDAQWEFIRISGTAEGLPALFVALILKFQDAAPVALVIWGGDRDEDSPYYFASDALVMVYPGAELSLYPLESKHHDKVKSLKDASSYFYEHLADQPHVHLSPPALTDKALIQLWGKEEVEEVRSSLPKAEFTISECWEMGKVILSAIEQQNTQQKPEPVS